MANRYDYYGSEGPKQKPKASSKGARYASQMGAEGPKRRKPNVAVKRVSPSARGEGASRKSPQERAGTSYFGSEGPKRRQPAAASKANKAGREGPKRSTPRTVSGAEGPKRKPQATTTRAKERMSATVRRQVQNLGVKGGTVRVGAKGKTIRKYNAKTGRWNVVSVRPQSSR